MIERIIESSIRNRFLVLTVAGALAVWGVYAVLHTPVDAIPDLSENQVIVFTDWMGRNPQDIQDQVTYPLSLKLQGLAGVKAIRSSSEFNFSMITIIFEDNVDYYFARQRVLEKLSLASTFLPSGMAPYMAPDATALGQVFWYTLEGSGQDLERLWALQKYYVGPELNSVSGVAEVAAVGGQPREYQIDVKPEALRAYGVTLGELYDAVARSNSSVGGRVIEKNNAEYLVRSVGWLKGVHDIEDTVVKTPTAGTPIRVKDLAAVQLGPQFRRSVFEKNGSEAVGGVVMMRYGENPLAVTKRVKEKIQALQPGLPAGVRVVPAYDRTRLITGAIDSLRNVMLHEVIIASLAVLLILMHVRSAFVICVTLPLSVLFSFLLMWVLRALHVVDIQANIMSLAGITISIGILVDQAIVMTENATHHLREHFGDKKVSGDTTAIVSAACRTVGRPIFFSVLIMLISFIPVFALSGREGKYFHPLAFTKSFALVGVALLSVTVVPALIPTFLRGRLRAEEDNWIVRSFINIYKPVLTWFLPRRNFVMWAFAVLLILAAGMFPLQAVLGLGASQWHWQIAFLVVFAAVTGLTVGCIRGAHWQLLGALSLVAIGLFAYNLPKIGVEYMPALDEGSILDMPVTVPRAGVTEAGDDLKARDALLRGFPEVESVIGKAGRADTPTDPAPIEMIETFVNFRPYELWPKRVLRFDDAVRQALALLDALVAQGYVARPPQAGDWDNLVNDVTQKALERFDDEMRDLALRRYQDVHSDLGPLLARFTVQAILDRFRAAGDLHWPEGVDEATVVDDLAEEFRPDYAAALAANPALEDVLALSKHVADNLHDLGALDDPAAALELKESPLPGALHAVGEALGAQRRTFAGEVLAAVEKERLAQWRRQVRNINWELFDRGVQTYLGLVLEELPGLAKNVHVGPDHSLLDAAPHGDEYFLFSEEAARARAGKPHDQRLLEPLLAVRHEVEQRFAGKVLLWRRQSGKKGDLVDDEFGRVLKTPGWSNIFTQPIINRIEMLSTGVRTDVAVKVFGPDIPIIERVCKEIERELKPINGARDVVATPITGKGYLEIVPEREKAARYGISVADVQDTVEVALGGRVVTQTVEGQERFPVRIRYARDYREDEESVRRLLVSPGMANPARADMAANAGAMTPAKAPVTTPSAGGGHEAAPGHSLDTQKPVQVPLGEVADVRIVEGPAMITSENGRLMNYVTLMVRGRDMVGFVDEAQRVVAERVQLPQGVSIAWTGEFEHQVRAAQTLRFVFPAVIVLIFVILYLTYKDLWDAGLMMLAVPEAVAGGAFLQFLLPRLMPGWFPDQIPFSVAVWVGYIACFGMATETGIIMLVYLREAIDKRGGLEKIGSLAELRQAVIEGAVHRLRPKLLTEGVAIIALAPMLFATGVGSEIIRPMAVPVLGGLLIADEVVDIFLPVRFYWVRRRRWLKLHGRDEQNAEAPVARAMEPVAQAVGMATA
jgi:Cu(I)/Ag(I) efflux system membrane protein CusA/SilA